MRPLRSIPCRHHGYSRQEAFRYLGSESKPPSFPGSSPPKHHENNSESGTYRHDRRISDSGAGYPISGQQEGAVGGCRVSEQKWLTGEGWRRTRRSRAGRTRLLPPILLAAWEQKGCKRGPWQHPSVFLGRALGINTCLARRRSVSRTLSALIAITGPGRCCGSDYRFRRGAAISQVTATVGLVRHPSKGRTHSFANRALMVSESMGSSSASRPLP